MAIDPADIGIVVGPQFNEQRGTVEIAYSVRVRDDDYDGAFQLDGRYTFENTAAETVMDEVYPAFVDRLDTAYPDAVIQSYSR